MFSELQRDIGDAQYPPVIDESTDVASVKQLCVVIRYFSETQNKVVSTFLGLINLEGETAEAIASTLTSIGLDILFVRAGALYSCFRLSLFEKSPVSGV